MEKARGFRFEKVYFKEICDDSRIMTTVEVAKSVGVSKQSLYNWLKDGSLKEPERDWRGWRLWRKKDVENVLELVAGSHGLRRSKKKV